MPVGATLQHRSQYETPILLPRDVSPAHFDNVYRLTEKNPLVRRAFEDVFTAHTCRMVKPAHFIRRLETDLTTKNRQGPGQFTGTVFELMVAAALLPLEPEVTITNLGEIKNIRRKNQETLEQEVDLELSVRLASGARQLFLCEVYSGINPTTKTKQLERYKDLAYLTGAAVLLVTQNHPPVDREVIPEAIQHLDYSEIATPERGRAITLLQAIANKKKRP